MPTPPPARLTERLEENTGLDALTERLQAVAATVLPSGRLLEELRGRSLGHAVHPIMTDAPLGAWIGATLLDLTGAEKHAVASRRLIGAGVLLVAPTALTGLADWAGLRSRRSSRVGAVHAVLNAVAGGTYAVSWLLRRRGHTKAGVAVSLAAGVVVTASGYLGGHLTLARSEPDSSAP
ncbi:hypothetical protein DNL40_09420 [Xylanimonas oleitrophica]|uniref:DUF2231 domain-containing protein n=2 Tax=Xylanimonas oleitrophica TaxID=2607479 RepID=A0A2W5YFD7_9MICO|nr:hypothetical protein DNL40_09420 [Xylanimonas oleitrophica]